MTLHLLPYREDLLRHCAERLLDRAEQELPDLSQWVILVADTLAAAPLRKQLVDLADARGHAALIGLRITTLRDWVTSRAHDTQPPLSDPARRLLLVEALREHSGLFGDDDPWRIAESLLELFDDLTRYHAHLPTSSEQLVVQLAASYGVTGTPPPALTREAQIVHRLWLAWREQTGGREQQDPWVHYLAQLQQQTGLAEQEPDYILLGHQSLIPAERDWLQARLSAGCAEWLVHGRVDARRTRADATLADCDQMQPAHHHAKHHGDTDPVSACLDNLFPQDTQDLRERALRLQATYAQSPISDQIRLIAADSAEQEARAIDIQVRRWLLEGKRRIGIVTEDRRLARRVRALLERAGIQLQDSGGWALSTTSAAACLERWLQSVEEDFAHQPLLDFLKSPFLCSDVERAGHLESVYRLEHDIIRHENIARGLSRYRRHIESRRQRLNWPATVFEPLRTLLDRIDQAAAPLRGLLSGSYPATQLLSGLRESLNVLGIWHTLEADAAGQRVIQLWEELDAAVRRIPLSMQWQEFRIWLGRALEEKTFRPSLASGPVQLLNLDQSHSLCFDAVAIGACDREHLPGKDRTSPFFNAGVRRELGLPTWEQRLDLRLYLFRRLLQSAPQVLLSRRREDQGEPVLPSPWVEALESLHQLAFGTDLHDAELRALLAAPESAVATPEPAALPVPPLLPRPVLPAALLPETTSASNHQHLLDCPYLYFAADCLQLAPTEAVRELLQKSDYGERVHRCLEAFHGDVSGLPGPFRKTFDDANRAEAIAMLQTISSAVFARDLEDNFQHRGWLKRWLQLIPDYVDWQIKRAHDWQVHAVELRVAQHFAEGVELKGRLDRIDTDGTQHAILDYKTGAIPGQDAIDSGEAVQLPIYALLAEGDVNRVEYLRVDGQTVRSAGQLSDERLLQLRDDVAARLLTTRAAIAAGAALPAWGDPSVCRYCPMDGLCRRAAWPDAETGAEPEATPQV